MTVSCVMLARLLSFGGVISAPFSTMKKHSPGPSEM